MRVLDPALLRATGFRLVGVEAFPAYSVQVNTLVHTSGATFIHVDSPGTTNNVFTVGFRTPVPDSRGVAHILEHTALCGSESFPGARDPFFSMLKRSLNTYMNALTADDYTMYPFSTQNEQDFDNLLRVYLDSTFFPALKELDFAQEGHRLSMKDGAVSIQGVVYNEMKGAMSDSGSILHQSTQTSLFPDTSYRFNSGGEPADIPSLTHEDLVAFHRRHYTPSNAIFFTFGSFAPPLERVNELVLSKDRFGSPAPVYSSMQPRFSSPKTLNVVCPPDPMCSDPSRTSSLSMAFVCNDTASSAAESVSLRILQQLLMEGPTSPLFEALVEPNYGSGFSGLTGYSSHLRQGVMGVGVQDMNYKLHGDEVLSKIKETLAKCAMPNGLDLKRIEAAVHQVELSSRTVSPRFGMNLGFGIIKDWVHRSDDVLASLRVPQVVEDIRERSMGGEPIFQDLIQKYMIDNPHSVTVLMEPEEKYLDNVKALESEKLSVIESDLSEEDKTNISNNCDALLSYQAEGKDPSTLAVLPELTVSDISPIVDPLAYQFQVRGNVQRNCQPTNGILYYSSLVNMKDALAEFTDNSSVFLPLFSMWGASVGAGALSYKQVSEALELKTGGIDYSFSCANLLSEAPLVLHGRSLERNIPDMMALYRDIQHTSNFEDEEHLKTLLLALSAGLNNSLQDSGHRYAMSLSAAMTGLESSVLAERFSGLEFVKNVNALTSQDAAILRSGLDRVKSTVADLGISRVSVVGDESCLASFETELDDLTYSTNKLSTLSFSKAANYRKVYVKVPIQVNHASMSINTGISYSHEDAPKLRLLGAMLGSCFLHAEIREKGGAYGSGARAGTHGDFTFFSFRDPNCQATVDTFEKSIEWASSGEFTQKNIEEAQMQLFSNLDAPVSPGKHGSAFFESGLDRDSAQLYRSRLLSVTHEDLVDVANRYLKSAVTKGEVSVAVLGGGAPDGNDWEITELK